MSELKFRAWDNVSNKMVSEVSIFPFEVTDTYRHKEDGRTYDVVVIGVNNKRFIPMQFTSLHDRNATPIFEGDILKYSFQTKRQIAPPYLESNNPGWEIYSIDYQPPSFMRTIHSQENSFFGKLPYKTNINIHQLPKSEVIGNIWEHPHLLLTSSRH